MSEGSEMVKSGQDTGLTVQQHQAQTLVDWAQGAQAAHDLVVPLSQTSFVPEAMKNVGTATAAVLMGSELGLSPIASLRSIYVVHGTPALYTRTMVALVQSRGHEVWTEESSEERVVVCGRRRGSEHEERSEWTMRRAEKAGYLSNKKYKTNPQEMLWSKAAAEVCRHIAADVLAAIPYTVEDMELEEEPETRTVTRSKPRRKSSVKRATAPEPVEPDIPEDEVIADVEDQPEPEPSQPGFDQQEAPDVEAGGAR